MDPAAALRGLANTCSPFFVRSLFISSSVFVESHTSPSTIMSLSFRKRSGTDSIVRTFAVTSSPIRPSPRVDAFFISEHYFETVYLELGDVSRVCGSAKLLGKDFFYPRIKLTDFFF